MSSSPIRFFLCLSSFALLNGPLAAASPLGTDPSEWTREQKEHFLRTAEIVHREQLEVGITGSERATLSDGVVTHDAHIQTVNEFRRVYSTGQHYYLGFWDSYRFNVAAYHLDRLLDLHMVPVSVLREIGRTKAAVTWWVDDVMMMEGERREKGITPPRTLPWLEQLNRVRVFNELIHNADFNTGNMLVAKGWKVWLIDFTRAFCTKKALLEPDRLGRVDRPFLERIRSLTRERLTEELGPYLTKRELTTLLHRRDRILESFDRRIEKQGEEVIVYASLHD